MPSQIELLKSAAKIDARLNNSKSVVKAHKSSKVKQAQSKEQVKAKARENGRLI